MEDRRRTRSQGPPSLSEENELIQWDSLQDPVRIKREHAEARRLAREANAVANAEERMVETSEILWVISKQVQSTAHTPQSGKIPQATSKQLQYIAHTHQTGKISPKLQGQEGHTRITHKSGEIPPTQTDNNNYAMPDLNEIPPKEPHEVIDLVAMEEGAMAWTPHKNSQCTPAREHKPQSEENTRQKLPQIDTAQHYLDDNFSDVMRSSALGSNVSSLFNTTAFNTTHNEQKVTLDWILPDGRNTQLEMLEDKHIMDFPAPGGNTGAVLVYLPEMEPFYNTKEFLVDLQSGELFVKLNDRWHPAGLTCRKRNFEVDSLMALIQHASIKLKHKLYGRKEEQTAVLTLDPAEVQLLPRPFIPSITNYVLHKKPMSPAMRKNYIKDRAQAAVTYITEYGNTALWSLEKLAPIHKLTQDLQIVFGREDAVRKAMDEAIENNDEIRRKKCMHYLKPPKRFPVPEDMESEETATWINWIRVETQAY